MSNPDSPPKKKMHSKKIDSIIIPKSNITSLEHEFIQKHKGATILKISEISPEIQKTICSHSKNDPEIKPDIFPDFAHERSQNHFLVSPEYSRPPSREIKPPIQSKIQLDQPNTRTTIPARGKRITASSLQHESTQKDQVSSTLPQQSSLFFSSVCMEKSGVVDSTLIQIVCSEPLLSEDDLLMRLKKIVPNITKQLLKQALVRNGLETDYKRFRAFMSG